MRRDDKDGLSLLAFWAIGIGSLLGVGWIMILGPWLALGPVNVIIGFGLGVLPSIAVGACYGELAGMMPMSGGEIVYANKVFGRFAAFVAGWSMLFGSITFLSYEIVSLPWVLETLFPVLQGRPLFSFLGESVSLNQLIVGQIALWAIYAINRRGLHASALTQEYLTVIKVVLVVAFVLGGFLLGEPAHMFSGAPKPLPEGQFWTILGIFVTAPYWFNGFQYVARVAGDRQPEVSMKSVALVMVTSAVVGAVIYCGIIAAAAAAAPIDQTINAHLPGAFAATAMFHTEWAGRAVLVAGLLGLLSVMNPILLGAARVLTVLREVCGLQTHDKNGRSQKDKDLTLVAGTAALIALAGKGALGPLVDSGSLATTVYIAVMCLAALKLRIDDPARPRPFAVPGGVPMLVAISLVIGCSAIFLLVKPLLSLSQRFPIEWMIFGIWTAVGVAVGWRTAQAHRRAVAAEAASNKAKPLAQDGA